MKDILEMQYARLCQELGDVQFKIHKLSQIAKEIKEKIDSLNNLTPSLGQISDLKSPKRESAVQKAENGTEA